MIDPGRLVQVLKEAFSEHCETPERQIYTTGDNGNGLLVMPAWSYRGYLGIKIVTTTPGNAGTTVPFVQGFYTLFDQHTGSPLMQIDAGVLTNYRTAAASALASTFLSRTDSNSLLMIGAGSLAPYLIQAHQSVRPITDVYIWSRNHNNARQLARSLNATAVEHVDEVLPSVSIVSCATPSTSPLVKGSILASGQHLDLVGGYLPEMREVDDAAVIKSRIYIDTPDALKEAGDLIQPMRKGALRASQIQGTLYDLCGGGKLGRQGSDEITLFKSTGHALEDIATAVWLWEGAK